ncbi:hypothetical protein GOV06_05330 [Candidatus Woesearchaeota archaeon]|nr:hypothetical protein [Candidatus Woesearchaeota archaeon]
MEYLNKIVNSQEYELSYLAENMEMIVYSVVSFFLPIVIGHPQIVVGIIVNAMLITAALNLKGYKLLPVILAPALGALSAGLLFGKFTVFLLYLIPFIWIGNAILVFAFKWLKLRLKKNYVLTLVVGSTAKSLFLFGAAFLLFKLGIIPVMFLTAMGVVQLTTALGGGIAAYGFQAAKRKLA